MSGSTAEPGDVGHVAWVCGQHRELNRVDKEARVLCGVDGVPGRPVILSLP